MPSIPQVCAEMRADFIERALWPLHVKVCEGMVQSSRKQGDNLFPYEWNGEAVARAMQTTMKVAEMWTATPEMLDVIFHAAKTMPPQQLRPEDLPSQDGFLWLPVPLKQIDIRGAELTVHAITWSEREIGRKGESAGRRMPEVARGIVIHMFTLLGDRDDPVLKGFSPAEMAQALANSPRLSLVHAQSSAFYKNSWVPDTSEIDGSPELKAEMARTVMRSSHDGEIIEQLPDGGWRVRTADGYVVKAVADSTLQFLSCYFHMVKSELTSIDRERSPKSSARWLRRIGMPDSPISVVRLRRRASGGETGRGFQLTYRYIRRAHWRQQWFGSGENRYQRAILIAPTLVGPEDGPLRIRDVVNIVER